MFHVSITLICKRCANPKVRPGNYRLNGLSGRVRGFGGCQFGTRPVRLCGDLAAGD